MGSPVRLACWTGVRISCVPVCFSVVLVVLGAASGGIFVLEKRGGRGTTSAGDLPFSSSSVPSPLFVETHDTGNRVR